MKHWLKEIWLEIKYWFRRSDPDLKSALQDMAADLEKPLEDREWFFDYGRQRFEMKPKEVSGEIKN